MNKSWTTPLLVLLMAGMASGCAVPPPQAAQGQDTAPTQQQPEDRTDQAADGVLAFGETYQGEINTTVTRTDPFTFTTSPYAAPQGSAEAWGVEITFTNTTDRAFSPVVFQIGATVDGRVAPEVFDAANGYNGLLGVPPIAPGQTVTVPVAYLGAGDKHTVTVSSLDLSESVMFQD